MANKSTSKFAFQKRIQAHAKRTNTSFAALEQTIANIVLRSWSLALLTSPTKGSISKEEQAFSFDLGFLRQDPPKTST